jgi:hypothetical protein
MLDIRVICMYFAVKGRWTILFMMVACMWAMETFCFKKIENGWWVYESQVSFELLPFKKESSCTAHESCYSLIASFVWLNNVAVIRIWADIIHQVLLLTHHHRHDENSRKNRKKKKKQMIMFLAGGQLMKCVQDTN